MSYKLYKNKVQITKLFQRIKDRILKIIFGILSCLLFPIWFPIFIVSKFTSIVKYHSRRIGYGKMTEDRDIRKDRNFKKNMRMIYQKLLSSKEYVDGGRIYITSDKLGEYLYYSILGDIVDDSYNEASLYDIYRNYSNRDMYSRAETIQLMIDELKNDKNLSVRWITSIKELDIERDVRDIVTPSDYDLFNRMLGKVELYRITERK